MKRSLPFLLCVLVSATACNDDPAYFPFQTDSGTDTSTADTDSGTEEDAADTEPADADEPDVEADVGTDAGETDTNEPDTEPDAPEPDVPEPDVPEPDIPEPDVPEMDTAPDSEPDAEPDIEPEVCTAGTECADGSYCGFDTEGCGFDPVCLAECPASEVVNVCGCGGAVARTNPLCTEVEFAYVLDDVDQRAELEGADCDPTEFGRLRYSANLSFSDMDFLVGRTLHIRVASNWDDSFDIDERIVIDSASFEVTVPNALDTDLFGWFFEWYIDVDDNGTCDFPDELSWSSFVSNPFDAGPVFVEISGTDEQDPFTCEFWEGE